MRFQIKFVVDESATPGAPELNGDGKNLSSLWVRCHPSDEERATRELKEALQHIGATNIQRVEMQ